MKKSKKLVFQTEWNENENSTIYRNLWNVGKAVLRGKCVLLNVHIRKENFESMTSASTLRTKKKKKKKWEHLEPNGSKRITIKVEIDGNKNKNNKENQ